MSHTQPSLFDPPPRPGLYRRANGRPTQCSRLLALLEAHRGDWVGLPEILALSIAQYGTRILELRRAGYAIENRTQDIDGKRHSWFRLVSKLPQESA